MARGIFLYQNAKIHAKLSRRLQKNQIIGLAEATTLSTALSKLRSTCYRELCTVYEQTQNIVALEKAIKNLELRAILSLYYGFYGAEKKFVQALLTRYEIALVKNSLNYWVTQRTFNSKCDLMTEFNQVIHDIPFLKIVNSQSLESLVELLKDTPYYTVLIPFIEISKKQSSIFYLHAALDLFYYKQLKIRANNLPPSNRMLVNRFLATEVDCENLIFYNRCSTSDSTGFHFRSAPEFFFPGGLYVKQHNIKNILENQQSLDSHLRSSYPLVQIKTQQKLENLKKIEIYRDNEINRLWESFNASNQLNILPVLLYFYWVKYEHKLLLGLLQCASCGLDKKYTMEILCL